MPRPFAIILALVAVIVGFLLFEPNVSAAKQADNFSLYTTSGTLVSLEEYRGKVVVLDFFASWCVPCKRAATDMERIHARYSHRGLVVLGVNAYDNNDPVEYVSRAGIPYPVLIRGEDVADQFEVTGIPAFVVISPEGDIVFRECGWSPKVIREMTAAIETQLARLGK